VTKTQSSDLAARSYLFSDLTRHSWVNVPPVNVSVGAWVTC